MRNAGAVNNNFRAGKVSLALEARERPAARDAWLAIGIQRTHADPIVERLQRQMEIFVGFELDYRQPPAAIECEQVQHAALTGRECGDMRILNVAAKPWKQL